MQPAAYYSDKTRATPAPLHPHKGEEGLVPFYHKSFLTGDDWKHVSMYSFPQPYGGYFNTVKLRTRVLFSIEDAFSYAYFEALNREHLTWEMLIELDSAQLLCYDRYKPGLNKEEFDKIGRHYLEQEAKRLVELGLNLIAE